MQASAWEFKNRASVFGMLFGLSFGLYAIDPVNSTSACVNAIGARWPLDEDRLAQWLLVGASLLVGGAALLRTWASAYLKAAVVYAAAVKSADLVADGPYRHVRNPLYLANVWLAIGMGAFMSRLGCILAIVAMWVFCYRLIRLEEAGFDTMQEPSYERYRAAVPRWWPSWSARTPARGAAPNWSAALKAECWCWGYALGALAFALTLKFWLFCTLVALSLGCFFFFNRGTQPDAVH
jgi:protein-S-isoprenylcysteine O-methyltransferase Ste14